MARRDTIGILQKSTRNHAVVTNTSHLHSCFFHLSADKRNIKTRFHMKCVLVNSCISHWLNPLFKKKKKLRLRYTITFEIKANSYMFINYDIHLFWFNYHHVRLKKCIGDFLPQTLNNRMPKCDIWNKMTVHNVQM